METVSTLHAYSFSRAELSSLADEETEEAQGLSSGAKALSLNPIPATSVLCGPWKVVEPF